MLSLQRVDDCFERSLSCLFDNAIFDKLADDGIDLGELPVLCGSCLKRGFQVVPGQQLLLDLLLPLLLFLLVCLDLGLASSSFRGWLHQVTGSSLVG